MTTASNGLTLEKLFELVLKGFLLQFKLLLTQRVGYLKLFEALNGEPFDYLFLVKVKCQGFSRGRGRWRGMAALGFY